MFLFKNIKLVIQQFDYNLWKLVQFRHDFWKIDTI